MRERRVEAAFDDVDVVEYGRLDYVGDRRPLLALRTRGWDDERPFALVTGGVHGYETSGIGERCCSPSAMPPGMPNS